MSHCSIYETPIKLKLSNEYTTYGNSEINIYVFRVLLRKIIGE